MPRQQKKYHYIYRTTCLITGKFYVGMHSTDNLEDGYLGSGKILGYSRQKYGDENHVREILEMLPSREALKLREKEIVNEELLANPLNINLKYGGDGGWDHKPGIPIHQQNVDVMRRARLAAETKRHRMKNPDYANALHQKISRAMNGNNNWEGKSHSTETKDKMSASMRGRYDGKNNPSFGSCWVTNGIKPIKIKQEQLEEYLTNGYSRGRRLAHRPMT